MDWLHPAIRIGIPTARAAAASGHRPAVVRLEHEGSDGVGAARDVAQGALTRCAQVVRTLRFDRFRREFSRAQQRCGSPASCLQKYQNSTADRNLLECLVICWDIFMEDMLR